VDKIACGCYHSMILDSKGYVFTFGRGNHGQLGHGNIENCYYPKFVQYLKDKRSIDIAGGFYHSIILARERSSKISYKLS